MRVKTPHFTHYHAYPYDRNSPRRTQRILDGNGRHTEGIRCVFISFQQPRYSSIERSYSCAIHSQDKRTTDSTKRQRLRTRCVSMESTLFPSLTISKQWFSLPKVHLGAIDAWRLYRVISRTPIPSRIRFRYPFPTSNVYANSIERWHLFAHSNHRTQAYRLHRASAPLSATIGTYGSARGPYSFAMIYIR